MDPATERGTAQVDELLASMSAQLNDLYADRERLVEATGLPTVDAVIEMIDSMRTQLESLYADREQVNVQERARS
ncbi:MAG: hypothetical protein AB7P40_08675 [Chloroflexota bacterium]